MEKILFPKKGYYIIHINNSIEFHTHGMKRGLRSPPSTFDPPCNSRLRESPFNLSLLHMVPWNSATGDMDEGYIWVWSTMQTNREQNASNMEDFKQ